MMQRLMSKKRRLSEEDGEVEIELDLGLSLHGRFGVDPLARRSLMRSSSVLDMVVNDRSGLSRTCSLPVETEEEWRKRKELQSLRRLEAKRKITEKQRKQKAAGREEKVVEEGSIGSSGSGSSGLSEVDALPPPPPPPPIQGRRTNKSMETSPSTTLDQPENPAKEASRNIIEDMPCVSTTGDGPNGKKIDGFLYRYRKGEEVKIVCVCHGSFLSPSEFVKHAGGSDVDHPLRHIVVNPSPFL